jgi:hypothetical protein
MWASELPAQALDVICQGFAGRARLELASRPFRLNYFVLSFLFFSEIVVSYIIELMFFLSIIRCGKILDKTCFMSVTFSAFPSRPFRLNYFVLSFLFFSEIVVSYIIKLMFF